MENITSHIKRLSLHDSHIEQIKQIGESLAIEFDWAKLENYQEKGIGDFIVMGRTYVKLSDLKKEIFRAYYEGKNFKEIERPVGVENSWQEIANTEIDEKKKIILLDGMYDDGQNQYWVEWELHYGKCEILWDSFVTGDEWKNGKLPAD